MRTSIDVASGVAVPAVPVRKQERARRRLRQASEHLFPPAGTLKSGGNRAAGVCWAGPGNTSLVRRMEFSGGTGTVVFNHGETDMGDKGSKDKGKREDQKKAQLSPKEKRKLKKEKKNK